MQEIPIQILEKAKNGSLSAFEQILFYYEKNIFNYLYKLTNHRQTAEDLTQETFIKLYKNLPKINLEENFKAWVYKIATNTARDYWRKQKGQKELFVESPEDFETIGAEDAYYELELEENSKEIETALSQLKPEYKTVLLLYYAKELSYAEVAENLNIPINTIKTYLHRAKKALKENLNKPTDKSIC
jgi:RNA polymerase sigma-70 factor, ECF subfamily